jgi:hypothetical protein
LAASAVAADNRPATLASGDPAPPPLGTRLRLTVASTDRAVVGSLVALDASTLTLRVANQPDATVVRRDSLTRVEVSAGHSSRGHGALLGLAIGAGVGAVVGIVGGAASNSDAESKAYGAAASGAILALVLGSVGAGVGALVPPPEKWNELPLDRVRVTLAPVRGRGVAISMAFAF